MFLNKIFSDNYPPQGEDTPWRADNQSASFPIVRDSLPIHLHRFFLKGLNHVQLLVLGYLLIVILVACLLMLPISSAHHGTQSFLDALFTATSGISTTGLTVVDIGSYYSLFGQIVLMLDFQIGGIGYMSLYILMAYLLSKGTSYKIKNIAKESMAGAEIGSSRPFFRMVIIWTLLFEIVGGIILCLFWMNRYSVPKSIYLGMFHSISAFCTAGFCLFPNSMMPYKSSILVNMTISLISLAGGIGFFVLIDIFQMGKYQLTRKVRFRLSLHSKLTLIVTTCLLVAGTLILLSVGKWDSSVHFPQRFMEASFQTISASTTDGFNTVNIGALTPSCLVMLILLMFVGASPGSTGGGIKTTTLGVLLLSVRSHLRGQSDTNYFGRRIPQEIIGKAYSVFFLFVAVIIADLLLLCVTERASFLQILFETTSALGNTGLSMGITSQLSDVGKSALTVTMFIGRVGPLTIGLAMIGELKQARFRYPEEHVFVG